MTRQFLRRLLAGAAAMLVAGSIVGPAGPAVADDATVAWSASPADESGGAGSRTRFEFELDAGGDAVDRVLIANASTVEQTFVVYGADAFNTPNGGYDVFPAATPSVDVGAWVTPEASTVTIPALSSEVVEFTVAVPDGATPGDHPGGVVVSLADPQADAGGVTIDSRVAVRLNVRVPGELAPELAVRSVTASYQGSWVPFGIAPAVITYEVVNSGNVKIVGQPRIRVTGPFGIRLAEVRTEDTREVLPGQSFVVESELAGIAPALVLSAVVDVDMVAAPGPETEIPLVSSTSRTTFFAVPWTGLAALALVVVGVWTVIRTVRRRRREGEQVWREMLDEARAEVATGPGLVERGSRAAGRAMGVLVALLAVAAVAAYGVPAAAVTPTVLAQEEDSGTLELRVPAVTPAPPPPVFAPIGGGPRTSGSPSPSPTPGVDDPSEDVPLDAGTPAQAGQAPDVLWNRPGGLSSAQWALLGVAAAAAAALAAFPGRKLLRAWRLRRSGAGAVIGLAGGPPAPIGGGGQAT